MHLKVQGHDVMAEYDDDKVIEELKRLALKHNSKPMIDPTIKKELELLHSHAMEAAQKGNWALHTKPIQIRAKSTPLTIRPEKVVRRLLDMTKDAIEQPGPVPEDMQKGIREDAKQLVDPRMRDFLAQPQNEALVVQLNQALPQYEEHLYSLPYSSSSESESDSDD